MSYTKKAKEIALLRDGGKRMGEILERLEKMVKPGVTGLEIDSEAERLIRESGGIPAFKGYKTRRGDTPFPASVCFSLNDEVVHGIPTKEKVIQSGDLVSLDIGMQWPEKCGLGPSGNGFFTDTALTVAVGKRVPQKNKDLIEVTRRALEKGIEQCVVGNSIAMIGRAIEDFVLSEGKYGIVKDLVGHGVGHAVHEDPHVPNYYSEELEHWILKENVVLALEPMITLGSWRVKVAPDGWAILTSDKSLSAHFEHTVIITKNGPEVITRRQNEHTGL